MTNKQLLPSDFSRIINEKKQSICFVSGNFNIIHPGHLRFLMFAAEQADILVVGLYDKKSSTGAFLSNEERLLGLNSLQIVSHIILIENNDHLGEVINTIKPSVVVKGKEFENVENLELSQVKKYGGKLIFSSGEKTFSSRALMLASSRPSPKISDTIEAYLSRKQIKPANISNRIEKFSSLNVCVIGDIIIDEYQECLPIGMSQEDPTIAVSPIESFKFLGGAGIVAAHAAGLGANVNLLSVTGNDNLSTYTEKKLQEYGIDHYVVKDDTRPTNHKLRYRAKEKTLLRVNNCRKHSIDSDIIEDLYQRFIGHCSNSDIVVFADFNYGLLCPKFIVKIQSYCRQKGISIVADSQTSSQVGDLNKFSNLMLTTPTEIEARGAVSDENSGLVQICTDLGNQLPSKNIIITLGSEGILIHHKGTTNWETDKLPAFSSTAIDTAGAGDAFFVTTALMLTVGANIWEAALLGSISASIQVNITGNKPMKLTTLQAHMENIFG